MIELNLLPQDTVKKRKKVTLPELPFLRIIIIFIASLLIVQLLANGFVFMQSKRLVALNKNWQALAPKKAELDQMKREVADNLRKIHAIDKLKEERINWTLFLNDVSNSLTPDVWLSEFSFDVNIKKVAVKAPPPKDPKKKSRRKLKQFKNVKMCILSLSGFASGRGEKATADIGRFIRALKNNKNIGKYFENIELVSIKNRMLGDRDVMSFVLSCDFMPEDVKN